MKSYKKIYTYYLDLLLKNKRVFCEYDDINKKYLLCDSYIISIVSENYLNNDCMNNTKLEHFFALPIEEYLEASKIVLVGSDKTVGLKHGDIEVLIDKKYYDLYKNCTFKIIGDIRPVLVYDNEKLIAFILPIKKY